MTVKILNMIKTIAVIYVITAIILLGLSFGLYKFNLSEWQIKAGIIITYIISSAVGGFMIGSRQKNKRLLWGALTGFLYFMILALISFIVGNVDEINIYDMAFIVSQTSFAMRVISSTLCCPATPVLLARCASWFALLHKPEICRTSSAWCVQGRGWISLSKIRERRYSSRDNPLVSTCSQRWRYSRSFSRNGITWSRLRIAGVWGLPQRCVWISKRYACQTRHPAARFMTQGHRPLQRLSSSRPAWLQCGCTSAPNRSARSW